MNELMFIKCSASQGEAMDRTQGVAEAHSAPSQECSVTPSWTWMPLMSPFHDNIKITGADQVYLLCLQ